MFKWWNFFKEPKQFYIIRIYQTNGKVGYVHTDMFKNYISKDIEEHILTFKTQKDAEVWFQNNTIEIANNIIDWFIDKITINVKVSTVL